MLCTICLALDTPGPLYKKEGDIIVIKPSDWGWGREERKLFLMDLGCEISSIAQAEKLALPLFSDGDAWWPEDSASEIIAKRRFVISFEELDIQAQSQGLIVDWEKVKNYSEDYQPFLDAKLIISDLSLILNKASGLRLTIPDLVILRDYGKF